MTKGGTLIKCKRQKYIFVKEKNALPKIHSIDIIYIERKNIK